MKVKHSICILPIIYIGQLSATDLETIIVEESFMNTAVSTVYEELQINNHTLSEKLFNNVSINQIDNSSDANLISIRGNNFRATDYYEDGVPLYKTATGFVDLSMYNDSSVTIDVNLGGAQSLYSPSAVGGEIVLNSKELKNGINGYIDTSLSTNDRYFNTLLSNKTDKYYSKLMLSGVKQNTFTLSDGFSYTSIQNSDKRVNSDKEQINGYLKMGYKIDNNSDIAFKVSHLKSNFGLPINVYDEPSNPFSQTADYKRVDDKQLTNYWFYYDYQKEDLKFTFRTYYDEYEDVYNYYNSPEFTNLLYPESTYYDDRLGGIASLKYNYSNKNSGTVTLSLDRNRHKQIIDNDPVIKKYEMKERSLAYLHNYKYSDKLTTTAALKYKMQNLTKAFNFNNKDTNYNDNRAVDAQLTLNYDYDNQQSYYLSVAKKNRFASLRELYPFFPWDTANSSVKPEKSNNIEVGTQLNLFTDTIVKLSTYYNKISDMIVYDSSTYKNVEETTIKGFEFNLYSYSIEKNDIELSYAYTDAKDKHGIKILYIPTSKFNFSDKIFLTSDIDFLVNFLYVSSINDSYSSSIQRLNSYSLLDMQFEYSPSKDSLFKIGVKNLLDENWEYRYAQPSKGRSFFVSLKYTY